MHRVWAFNTQVWLRYHTLAESTVFSPTLTPISLAAKPSPYPQWKVCFRITVSVTWKWGSEACRALTNQILQGALVSIHGTAGRLKQIPPRDYCCSVLSGQARRPTRQQPIQLHLRISTSVSFSSRCFAWILSLDSHSSPGKSKYHSEDKQTDVEKGHSPTRHWLTGSRMWIWAHVSLRPESLLS